MPSLPSCWPRWRTLPGCRAHPNLRAKVREPTSSGHSRWMFALTLCLSDSLSLCLSPDESSPPKSPWGINIMKKSKKSGPKAFGVRLEDCQPAANNKVSQSLPSSNLIIYCKCIILCVFICPVKVFTENEWHMDMYGSVCVCLLFTMMYMCAGKVYGSTPVRPSPLCLSVCPPSSSR